MLWNIGRSAYEFTAMKESAKDLHPLTFKSD